jgi:hypothetical protein
MSPVAPWALALVVGAGSDLSGADSGRPSATGRPAAPHADPAVTPAPAPSPLIVDTSSSSRSVRAGGDGVVVVRLSAAEGYELRPETRTLVEAAAEGLRLRRARLDETAARVEGAGLRFELPFIAGDPGPTAVAVELSAFVCRAAVCERVTARAAVAVVVEPSGS